MPSFTFRLAMAIDMPSKGDGEELCPLLKRFVHVMACHPEGSGKELTFRAYMACFRIFGKMRVMDNEKLKFWYNVMKCSHDMSDEDDQDVMQECLERNADHGMVASFLCHAVLSDLGGISSGQSKSKSVSTLQPSSPCLSPGPIDSCTTSVGPCCWWQWYIIGSLCAATPI